MDNKKEKWIAKATSNPNMVWIDRKDESIEVVADSIWSMYDEDFNLTIGDITNILLCERKWVENNVKPHVKHIFLNTHIRDIMYKQRENVRLKDYYYFSRIDFYRWLQANTKASRQTISVDMFEYANNKYKLDSVIDKHEDDLYNAKSLLERAMLNIKCNQDVCVCLNETGKELYYVRGRSDKRIAEPVEVDTDLPNDFISVKELKKSHNNNERVYRSLYECGAIRYEICGSLVRFDKKYIYKVKDSRLNIYVPYTNYITITNNII